MFKHLDNGAFLWNGRYFPYAMSALLVKSGASPTRKWEGIVDVVKFPSPSSSPCATEQIVFYARIDHKNRVTLEAQLTPYLVHVDELLRLGWIPGKKQLKELWAKLVPDALL